MRIVRLVATALMASVSGVMAAPAANLSSSDPFSGYEFRLAGLSHDLLPKSQEEGFVDIGGSIVFPKVGTGIAGIPSYWIPRAQIGGSVNPAGKTSFAYAGVTWTVPLASSVYFAFDFGGALNNGEANGSVDRVAMGCRGSFREAATLGYSLTEHVSVAATIEHFSNAHLCEKNDGVTNAGLMVGYKF